MLKLLYKVHKWVALALFVLLLPQLASGVYLAVTRAAEPAASAAQASGPQHSLDELLAEVRAGHPGMRVDRITLDPARPGWAEFRLWQPGSRIPHFAETDGAAGRTIVTGDVFQFPDKLLLYLHSNLVVGGLGRWLVAAGGIGLLALLATGLVLWWPARRPWRDALRLHLSWAPKLVLFDLHRVVGAYGALLAIVTIGAGTILALQPYFAPVVTADYCRPASAAGGPPVSLDEARAAAIALHPGHSLRQVRLCTPDDRVAGFLFAEARRDSSPFHHQVWIDRQSAAAPRRVDLGMSTTAGMLDAVLLPLHTGRILGRPGEWAVALLGASLAFLLLTGGILWWLRSGERRARAARRRAAMQGEVGG